MCSQWGGVQSCTSDGNLQELSLEDNQLTGSLPEQWSALTGLTNIYLNENQLTGSLPEQWSALTGLTRIYLYKNELTGSLPEQWSSLTSLTLIYLYKNELTGSLPEQWSSLTSLTLMYLHENQLTGSLPEQWSALTRLTTIYLQVNQLTGPLPEQWSALTGMTYMWLSSNTLTGSLPEQWSTLAKLVAMWLYNNKLTGSLPEQWSALVRLREMLIGENCLEADATMPSGLEQFSVSSQGGPSCPQPPPAPSQPPSPPPPPTPLVNTAEKGTPPNALIGGSVGGVVALLALVAGCLWLCRSKSSSSVESPQGGNSLGKGGSTAWPDIDSLQETAKDDLEAAPGREDKSSTIPAKTKLIEVPSSENGSVLSSTLPPGKQAQAADPASVRGTQEDLQQLLPAREPGPEGANASDGSSALHHGSNEPKRSGIESAWAGGSSSSSVLEELPSSEKGGHGGEGKMRQNGDLDSAQINPGQPLKHAETLLADSLNSQYSVDSLELVEPLDEGSFGAVYHMRMKHDHSHVAVKIIPVKGKKAHRSILKEVAMLKRLSNPNVVQFFGTALASSDQLNRLLKTSSQNDGANQSVLLVTELARGGSLYDFYYEDENDYVKPWSRRVDLGKQIAAGVHYLHSHSPPVVHCDLKSKNVLLKKGEDGWMVAKLCDFGQSLTMAATETRRSTLPSFRGTLAWCAPEVLRNAKPEYTRETDVYSLGMTLYELAALEPPFNGALDTVSLSERGVRPKLPEDTPAAFKSLIEDCWNHDPALRPTATDVCRRLAVLAADLEAQDASLSTAAELCIVFMSHNWGPGNGNHDRVARIYKALQRHGVNCWFDEDNMKAGGIREKMARGIETSKGVLCFITDEYRNKVNGENDFDNCKYEFGFASLMKADKMQAVVLEPQMRDPKTWGGQLGGTLGCKLYTDMSDIDKWDDQQLDDSVRNNLIPKLRELNILV